MWFEVVWGLWGGCGGSEGVWGGCKGLKKRKRAYGVEITSSLKPRGYSLYLTSERRARAGGLGARQMISALKLARTASILPFFYPFEMPLFYPFDTLFWAFILRFFSPHTRHLHPAAVESEGV